LAEILLKGLIAEIERELENLAELRREMKQVKGQDSIIFRRSAGSILHDFYNLAERIFRKVATDINGGYEDSERWHKALLVKMTVPIKGVRPGLLSEELAAELDEFLSFRHLFRNIYGFELKGERITYLARKFDPVAKRFINEIKKFLSRLENELRKK
jgi:HepT-like protein